MDLLSYTNISTVLIVLHFIRKTIFELQTYGPHIFSSLFLKCVTTLHLNCILNELCGEINLTDLLMPYFFIFCVSNFHVGTHFITVRICKTKKTTHSEKSVQKKLLSKNNKPNRCILGNRNVIYKCCCAVYALYDADQMGVESRRLATFRDMQNCTNCPVTTLAHRGLFYNADTSTVHCCRCGRTLSESDDLGDPHSWHEEGCHFENVLSQTYGDLFRQNQESVIHQLTSEERARHRSETVQNAVGSQQEAIVPLAASQGAVGGSWLPNSEPTSSTVDRRVILRSQTTSVLASAQNAIFNDHHGPFSRTSSDVSGDQSVSEPSVMFYTEITPTRHVTEGVQSWQSHTEIGHGIAVSEEAWAISQSVQENLPTRHHDTPPQNTADTRRQRHHSGRRRHSRQQKCCCLS